MEERDYIPCDICEKPLYRRDGEYDGEDYWELDENIICEDCIHDYVRSKKRTLT